MKYLFLILILISIGCVTKKKETPKPQKIFDRWSGYSAECCGWNGIVCKDCKE